MDSQNPDLKGISQAKIQDGMTMIDWQLSNLIGTLAVLTVRYELFYLSAVNNSEPRLSRLAISCCFPLPS
jgi:hypothetical protein